MIIQELLQNHINNIPPVFSQGDILEIAHTKNYDEMRVKAAFPALTDEREQSEFEETARKALGLKVFVIIPRFSPALWGENPTDSAMVAVNYLRRTLPAVNGHFNNAVVEVNGETVDFTIDKPDDFLKLNSFCKNYSRLVADMFGVKITATLKGGEATDTLQKKREELIKAIPPIKEEAPKPEIIRLDKEELVTVDFKSLPILQTGAKILRGKKITGNDIYHIGDINGKADNINIWGDVFKCETRDSKTKDGREYTRVKLSVTDYSGSIYVKYYDDKGSEGVKPGTTVLMKGKSEYDTFESDYVFTANHIMSVEREKITDTADQKRVELHLHTNMSALDAMTPAAKLVRRAFDWGHKAIAITDHGVVQAFPEADSERQKIRRSGGDIKLLFGCEAYFIDDELDKTANLDELHTYHQIIIAKNAQGLKNLYRLISYANLRYFKRKPRIPKSVLKKYRDGLIIGSACEKGELFQAILAGAPLSRQLEIANFYDYLEIQPLDNNRFMSTATVHDKKSERYGERIYPNINSDEDLRELNRTVVRIGEKLGIPVCATCDVHFMDKKDSIFRSILTYSMYGKSETPLYFRTTPEMLEEFSYLGEDKAKEVVVKNPNLIADMVNPDIVPFPPGTFAPYIEGADTTLINIINENLHKIYGENPPEIVTARIKKEIDAIVKHGFSVLYMIAQKLVKYSNDNGYQVGSRGSVGSSFAAFLAGISEVNPLPPHYLCADCSYVEFIDPDIVKRDNIGSGYDLHAKACPVCGNNT
jgi:DNA polymerase-3 subunit alpha (Gram-positive type)